MFKKKKMDKSMVMMLGVLIVVSVVAIVFLVMMREGDVLYKETKYNAPYNSELGVFDYESNFVKEEEKIYKDGKLHQEISYNIYETGLERAFVKQYYYNSDGKIERTETRQKDGDVVTPTQSLYEYGDDDRLISIVGSYVGEVESDGPANYSIRHEYTSDGKLYKEVWNLYEGGRSIVYEYNEDGKIGKKITSFFWDRTYVDEELYSYRSDGQIDQIQTISDYEQDSITKYVYSDDGKLIKTETHNEDGNKTSETIYEYK